jgi:hypothetical protein
MRRLSGRTIVPAGPLPGRIALAAGALALALTHPSPLAAQTVSPPVSEYQERARASFQLSNGTIFPLVAVLEVKGFRVTETGDVVDAPLDTARVHVKLSATSFRIPPRGTYTVFYEATGDSLPAWFVISSALSGARTDNGLNLRIILPHVVYLNQKGPLRRDEIVVRRLELDPVAQRARVLLENTGDNLGRVRELNVASAKNESRAAGGFPMFPHFRRWVEIQWQLADPPARAQVRFAKFTLDTALVAAPAAADSAQHSHVPAQAGTPPTASAPSPASH